MSDDFVGAAHAQAGSAAFDGDRAQGGCQLRCGAGFRQACGRAHARVADPVVRHTPAGTSKAPRRRSMSGRKLVDGTSYAFRHFLRRREFAIAVYLVPAPHGSSRLTAVKSAALLGYFAGGSPA
jgi:hypothetical protein